MIRNSPVAIALLFAIAKARAVWVPVNVQSRGENLGYIFDHSAPKLIIAEEELKPTIEASGANLVGAQVISVEALQETRGAIRVETRARRHLDADPLPGGEGPRSLLEGPLPAWRAGSEAGPCDSCLIR